LRRSAEVSLPALKAPGQSDDAPQLALANTTLPGKHGFA